MFRVHHLPVLEPLPDRCPEQMDSPLAVVHVPVEYMTPT